ncbi:hypothetical protein [Streptomyces sp. BE147]|uniref:hypothetical protein n=1 Tax=unclassified Streptomyces TaxID=2593676 RepID=UPI002E76B293|nr:hypothetical protein [Streptomyces sp. BE147]MEE1740993.1 hypothetical protein [Streptomyces sp. BE147]
MRQSSARGGSSPQPLGTRRPQRHPATARAGSRAAELGVRVETLLVEAVFLLAEAAKAHALGKTGRTTGEIVLTVVPEQA